MLTELDKALQLGKLTQSVILYRAVAGSNFDIFWIELKKSQVSEIDITDPGFTFTTLNESFAISWADFKYNQLGKSIILEIQAPVGSPAGYRYRENDNEIYEIILPRSARLIATKAFEDE